jgi:glycosyltransferase involved in cell wall biosynthesis
LTQVLNNLARTQAPASGWKLVVVDNGSTDRTREIIESFLTVLPLTYVFEGNLGKSAALNTGLAHLVGDLAVFTDDDVFPRSDWLSQLRKAVDDHPSYSIFGGVILPRWEVPPSPWIGWVPPAPVFSITDPRLREGPTDSAFLYGPNIAIRADVFHAGTRFEPSIGPRGPEYPMGNESELLQRLKLQGHKAWYVQEAVVEHFIRDYQMNKSWMLKRAIRFGRGQLRLLDASGTTAPRLFGVPRPLFLRMLKRFVKISTSWVKSDKQQMFLARWELNYLWGHVVEARRLRRRRHSQGDKEA